MDPTRKMYQILTRKNMDERKSREKALKFPVKLMYALESGDYDDIIAWYPNGTAFVIIDPTSFENIVLPDIFKVAKFSSFDRKLKRWGFERAKVRRGTNQACCYGHNQFRRGNYNLCNSMKIPNGNNSPQAIMNSLLPIPETFRENRPSRSSCLRSRNPRSQCATPEFTNIAVPQFQGANSTTPVHNYQGIKDTSTSMAPSLENHLRKPNHVSNSPCPLLLSPQDLMLEKQFFPPDNRKESGYKEDFDTHEINAVETTNFNRNNQYFSDVAPKEVPYGEEQCRQEIMLIEAYLAIQKSKLSSRFASRNFFPV